ncbi:hypothetical protein D3C75_872120 [compost metagenome]
MEVVGLRGYHFDKYGEALLDDFLQDVPGVDDKVFNVGAGQLFEQANLLRRIQPDLYVGHLGGNGAASKQGFSIFPLFGQSNDYLGYQGVFEVATRVARIMRNSSFNRNLGGNTKLPYRESWYSEDPFTYIDHSALEENEAEVVANG